MKRFLAVIAVALFAAILLVGSQGICGDEGSQGDGGGEITEFA